VASGAFIAPDAELIGMGILVTLGTSCGSTGKANVQHGQLHVRRLVAICTWDRPVRALQRKARMRMVEL